MEGLMLTYARSSFIAALALAGALGCGDPAGGSLAQTITVPAQARAAFVAPTCTVGPGPSISLTGELALAGLGADLIFRNNQKGTHERVDELVAAMVLIPYGETIDVPAPALVGGPDGAPLIYVQFLDRDGRPVSGELSLGACGAADFPASAAVSLPTTVTLTVSASGCANAPGPTITVGGAVEFAGLQVRIIVRSPDGSTAGATLAAAAVVALAAGETHAIPKQPARGGVGGNPWIWAQLVDAAGAPLSDEIFLGRCQDL
jgi:hypothetical protein